MYGLVIFLIAVPFIGVIATIVGIAIALCCGKGSGSSVGEIHPTPDVPAIAPTREPSTEHPDLADQFDGRLTNVFKNPMKGIL